LAHTSAAHFYRRYLSLSEKEPANAPMVKELIAEMDTRAGEKAKAHAKAADRPKAEPSRRRRLAPRPSPFAVG